MRPYIQLSDSYYRSTNLDLDFKDPSKLKPIYFSSKFQTGYQEILVTILESNSKHRVKVLSGSPGLGKSTFALFIAQAVSKKHPQIVKNLIAKSRAKLKKEHKRFAKSKTTKLLPVFINGYEGEIETAFKNKLKKSLTEIGIDLKQPPKSALATYKKALDLLKTKGYGGIFVIYDEFGKYLEKGIHNPTNMNIQFLQDFAEFCDRSGAKQCHLMLITHLSISQYASQLPINIQQEWAKIEGRFQESAFYDKNTDYYKMISFVFKKNISQTNKKLSTKYQSFIKKYLKGFKAKGFEAFIDQKNLKAFLLNCYPLHPVVLGLLPHLSKKISQNERTMYTFLTRDENHSLKRFLSTNLQEDIALLKPFDLYKYFSPLIGKDVGIGGTYKIQLIAEEAFNLIDKKDEVSKQIISLMALCGAIRDFYFTPLTEDFISSCFNQSWSKVQIKKAIKNLKNKKLIFYNKNIKQYLLQEGSPIDIDEEISKIKNVSLTSKALVQILKRHFKTDFITPKKYNFDHAITRFYRTEMISVEELKSLKSRKTVDFYREDGAVFYVIPFSHDELIYAKKFIKNFSSPLTVFVLPHQFVECRKDIEELNAVHCLSNNKEIVSTTPLVKKELDRYKDILLHSISSLLKPLIGSMRMSATVHYPLKGKNKKIKCFNDLQRFLGDLFVKEYSKYIKFNLEYMNRHSVSGSITLGRKNFIDKLRAYKKDLKDIRQSYTGKGPDYAIFDTMCRFSNFKYNSNQSIYEIPKKSDFYRFFKEYKAILNKYSNGISVDKLLDLLIAPPFGFRLGTIPVFIALSDLCLKQPVNHYFDSAYVKDLDGDHYDLLMKYPKKTVIHYMAIDNKQQSFLDEIGSIFNTKNSSIRGVIEGLLKWRKTVPESTKLSQNLSKAGRKLLIQIDSSIKPDQLLFDGIPKAFEKSKINSQTTNTEIKDTLKKISQTKKEIDGVYKKLLLKIKFDLISFANYITKQCFNNSSKLINNKLNLSNLDFVKTMPENALPETTENLKPSNKIKFVQNTLKQVKDYPLSSGTNHFIGRVLNFDPSNYEQYFLETSADVLTGSSPRHWNSKTYSQFKFALKKITTEIELACEIAQPNFNGQTVLAFIDKGKNKKTFIKLSTYSGIDRGLNSATKEIQNQLKNFDEIDKRKIILSVLEAMNKQSLEKDDEENRESETYNEGVDANV